MQQLFLSLTSLLLLLLLLLKPAGQAQVGKKYINKLLSQPHKHRRHGKLKKTQLVEASTVVCTLEPSSSVRVSNTV